MNTIEAFARQEQAAKKSQRVKISRMIYETNRLYHDMRTQPDSPEAVEDWIASHLALEEAIDALAGEQ